MPAQKIAEAGNPPIRQGDRVELWFSLHLADGELVDSNRDQAVGRLVVGDGTLPKGMEKLLLGLVAGQRRRFEVLPEQGFGPHHQARVVQLPRASFAADLVLEEGLVVLCDGPGGARMPAVVRALSGESVKLDFNHPLAGHALLFDVEILAVEPGAVLASGH